MSAWEVLFQSLAPSLALGGPDAVPPVFPGNALGMHLRAADLEGFPVQHELLVPFPAEPEHNGGPPERAGFCTFWTASGPAHANAPTPTAISAADQLKPYCFIMLNS